MRESRVRRTFDLRFQQDALALLSRTDRSMRQVARDLGISQSTLNGWYRAAMARKGKKPTPGGPRVDTEAETGEEKVKRLERENAALRKRVDDLEQDRAILKKAAAFFAKESE